MNILLDELSRPSCESPGETISVSDSPRSSEPTFSEQNTPEKSAPDSSEFSPASSVETPPKSHARVYSLLAKPSVRFPKLKQCLTMSSIKQRQPELITSSQTTVSTASSPKPSSHSQADPNPQEATQFVRMRERPRGADFPQPEPDNFLSLPMLLGSEAPLQFTKIKPRPRGNPQEACRPLGVEGSSPPNDNSNLVFADRLPQPRREADEPRRPKNGFIRFSIEHRAEMLQKYPYKDNRTISKLLGLRWKKMTREEKRPYEEEFSKDIHEIRSQNPEWRYAPAKRSVEELIDPMEKRLRPRQKLRTKSPELVCCHKNAKHNSCCEQGHFCKGRQLLHEEKNRRQQCDFCGQCCSHASPYQLPRISYAWCPVGQAYQSNVYQRVGESTLNPNTHLQSINIPTSLSAGVSAQLIQLPIQHGNHQLSIQHSSNQAGLTLQPQVFVVLPGFATLNPASYGTSNSVSQTVYPQSQTQFHHQAGFESQLLSSGLQTQQS